VALVEILRTLVVVVTEYLLRRPVRGIWRWVRYARHDYYLRRSYDSRGEGRRGQ
jgi:hypothetical protein